MQKFKNFIRSVSFSVKLSFSASGPLVLLYLLLNLTEPTVTLFSTVALKFLLDGLTAPEPLFAVMSLWAILYALSLILSHVNQSAKNIVQDSIFSRARHLYESKMTEALIDLPLSEIDSSAGRDKLDDVRRSMNTVVYLPRTLIRSVSYFYTFAVAFAALLYFDIFFSLLFVLLSIPGVILNEVFDRKAEALRLKQAPDIRKFCYYRWMLTDAMPAKDVRMYDLTDDIKRRYDEEKSIYLRENKSLDKKKLTSLTLAELLKRSGLILFTLFVIFKAARGEITVGDIALYIGFAGSAINSFHSWLFNFLMPFERSSELIMRGVLDFFERENKTSVGTRRLSFFESLEFRDVYFKYPHTDSYVLQGASFTLNCGDKLSIVGINGSGKSTLIKLMLGLYEIESGSILINGARIEEYDIRDVRRLFSALFQNYVQYPLTLRENVALSSIDKLNDDSDIEAALEKSGILDSLGPKLERGLDSHMTRKFDDKGTALSKGQWQKLALSRAYFKNADIIIFDEPSAALDAEAEDKIFSEFASMSDGKTGIMISHRISAARLSNKVIVLDGGRITESGTHDELLSLGGLYAKLYKLQREKYTMKEEE